METAFFYIFAFLTLLCGVLVIANPFTRNPVTSAMFLVLTIVSMGGLFLLLHALFLAAVKVIVWLAQMELFKIPGIIDTWTFSLMMMGYIDVSIQP